jgi:hypothetical protein
LPNGLFKETVISKEKAGKHQKRRLKSQEKDTIDTDYDDGEVVLDDDGGGDK